MAIGDDFEIQNDKDIRYTGTVANYTVLELHRWLQGLADDAGAAGDDFMDMTKDTPSDKSFDTIINLVNGFNIDDTAAQHLYGGSIIQSGGDVIYDGIQVLAPAGMRLEVIQNGALVTPNFWTTGLNADSANGISHRFMLKVRTAGADIDGRRLLGTTREWGKTFLEFGINGTSRGVNVMAFTGWADDLNNTTSIGSLTGSPFTSVSLTTAGYNGIDVNNDTTDEFYYSEWNRGTASINQFYERMKYLTRRGETTTLFGLAGELFRGITHEITVDTPSATDFSAVEAVSWSGGTGQMLAINDVNAPTKMWIQLRTGVAPTDNQTITGGTSGATCLVNVTVTERTVSAPFCGASTGSSIIGAYGFGIEALDLSASDKVFDLTNTLRQAPNYVTFSVGGIVSGEDYVLVGPASGGVLDVDQFTLNGALTGAAVTSVVVNGAIPADTPATGTIRILRANGAYSRHPYSAWASSTFTITSHDFSGNNAANGANTYISYIDKLAASTSESFTSVYASDRDLFIRVRDGGASPIKTFESTGTLGSAGGSATAVRTSDA
jgi:hypothetical protein